MLGKKQNIRDNAEWINAFEKCTEVCSSVHIQNLEEQTIEMIQRATNGYDRICSGWIAGKDSLVLDSVLQKSGIDYTPVMWRGVNEYPEMIAWIEENRPRNLIEDVIDKYSLEFLEKNPDYLFCQNGTRQKWMQTKWQRYKKVIKENGFDLFIVARRLKDGNQCGSKHDDFIVKKDFDTFSPLAEWTHEELLAYIKYNGIELPPFYSYKRGFLIGSVAMGEWTERPAMQLTVDEVWQELYDIDKSIVEKAAGTLTSAKAFMKGKQ